MQNEAAEIRTKQIYRVTLLGMFVNMVLFVFKLVAGIVGRSGAMIADANDLHRCRVVGASNGLEAEEAAKLLLDNPFGNASQKVPIVIIKGFGKYIKNK